MRRTVLTFGLIAGVILSAMMVMTVSLVDKLGFDHSYIIGYTTMVIAFVTIFFGVKSYRETVGGGQISFGRAFAVGLLITLIATACYVATWEFVYYNIWPDFADRYAAQVIAKARASGATEAQIAEREKQMAQFKEMYKNPLVNVAYTSLEPLPVGLLMTLISAGVLRRRRDGTREPVTASVLE